MAKRPCIVCGKPSTGTRCLEHARLKDQSRGSRQERGYDGDYERQLRSSEYLAATNCAECKQPFTIDNPKTGGHTVALRHGGKGSEVVPHCRDCNYGWQRTGL